ncbi:MAG: hypothetical protein AAFX92_03875 [Pseudomonadota bacterium]
MTFWTFQNIGTLAALAIAAISVTFTALTYRQRWRQDRLAREPVIEISASSSREPDGTWDGQLRVRNRDVVTITVDSLTVCRPRYITLIPEAWDYSDTMSPQRQPVWPDASRTIPVDMTLSPTGTPAYTEAHFRIVPTDKKHEFYLQPQKALRPGPTTVAVDVRVTFLGPKAKTRVFRSTFQMVQHEP